MKYLGMVVGVSVAMLLACSTAEAVIANGPGGRIYMEGFREFVAADNSLNRRVASVTVNADWTISPWVNHGTYLTNKWVDGIKYAAPLQDGVGGYPTGCWGSYDVGQPWLHANAVEIQTSNPTGYATLITPSFYQGARDPNSGICIMDVLSITPTGAGLTVTDVGGRSATGGASDAATDLKHTQMGVFAVPDPNQGFTGPNADYVVGNHEWYYQAGWVTTGDSGSGVGGTDADYIYTQASYKWTPAIGEDYEIVGGRLFIGGRDPSYGYMAPGGAGGGYGEVNVRYIDRVNDSTYNNGLYYASTATGHRYNLSPTSAWSYSMKGIAAGKITDNGENWAVWTLAYDTTDAQPEIVMLADYNGDGDALDAGEAVSIFDTAMAGTDDWADPANYGGSYKSFEFELIESGDTKFLMGKVQRDGYNNGYLIVWELADNGDYAGSPNDVRYVQVAQPTFGSPTYARYNFFEFDPIPEPGSLLLVGTGVLGVFGYLRRRRMR